jgi:hypothetical protein
MTPGAQFNYLATGSDMSSSAPGVFAEAYWNGGWWSVMLSGFYIGAAFAWFTRKSMSHMARLDYRWAPCGVFGLLMGLRIDDWFAAAYVGSVVVALFYLLLTKAVFQSGHRPARLTSFPRRA